MQSKYTPLGLSGIVLIVVGLLVWAIMTELSPYAVIPLALGGVLALAYAIMNIGFLVQKITGRSAVEGINMTVGVIIVLAIIVFLQMILQKHSTRFDMTEAKKYSLASQTIQTIQGLEEELTLQYLINPSAPGETQRAKDLMELYTHYSDQLKTEIIDPEKSPEKVQALAPVTLAAIYVRKGDQHEKVSPVNENNLTNAIMKLVKGGGRIIYFVTGHGERSLDDDTDRDGMSGIKKLLEEEGYQVKELQLATATVVPEDAVAVVIAGPKRPYFETEQVTLENYLKFGGRLVVMLDPDTQSGLESFFEEKYGVIFGKNYIYDNNPLMQLFGGGNALAPIVSSVESHAIVDAFSGSLPAMPFPLAQSLKKAETLPEGEQATEFIKTSNRALVGQPDVATQKFTPDKTQTAPFALGIALSKPAEKKVSSSTETEEAEASDAGDSETKEEEPETRIVVYGDSDFVSNKLVNNSYDLFINSINWLAKQEDLISIRPKDDSGQPVMISKVQANFVRYTSLIILPAFIAIIGIVVGVRKRLRG